MFYTGRKMERIGILGGTFDPVHNMHIKMAKEAKEQFDLKCVLLMPNPNPGYKSNKSITDIKVRCEMLKIAENKEDGIFFSDFELKREGAVYSADTVCMLREEWPDTEIFFIAGQDSLLSLESWHDPGRFLKNCVFVVAKRAEKNIGENEALTPEKSKSLTPETPEALKLKEAEALSLKEKYGADIRFLKLCDDPVSSTDIRKRAELGMDISAFLPRGVCEYINKNGLYLTEKSEKIRQIKSDLKKIQNNHRFSHTKGVAETAYALAACFNEDTHDAYVAGLLHDCAKTMSDASKIKLCVENGIEISDAERINPFLLHAKAGAHLAKEKYGITNEGILSAIRFHTTGRADMTMLEKIIFTADYIEPGRDKAENLAMLRKLAFEDLDKTVYIILRDTVSYLKRSHGDAIDETTVRAFEFYKRRFE